MSYILHWHTKPAKYTNTELVFIDDHMGQLVKNPLRSGILRLLVLMLCSELSNRRLVRL